MNRNQVTINWKFTRKKARQKFGYKETTSPVRDLAIRASASGDLLLYVTTITKGLASMYRKGDVLVSLLCR
jgi:hypothetical protein